MALKVIGAGFGRTGTNSLRVALEKLGIEKCYHMTEVMTKPGHMSRWTDIMAGNAADWETLFDGYQAAVDWPVSAYYKELMEIYPDSKVILTVRDPERWHESIMGTIYQLNKRFSKYFRIMPAMNRFSLAMDKVIWQGIFNGNLEDKAHATKVFKEHIEEVKRTIPIERLLIFEAKQGWEPLCAFLDIPVPEGIPYPHTNDSARIKRIMEFAPLALWGLIAIIFLAVLIIQIY